jgi:hypothetical protein
MDLGVSSPTSFREAIKLLSSTVLCNVTQFNKGNFSIVFDASHSMSVAQKTQIDQRGFMRFFGLPIFLLAY